MNQELPSLDELNRIAEIADQILSSCVQAVHEAKSAHDQRARRDSLEARQADSDFDEGFEFCLKHLPKPSKLPVSLLISLLQS